MTPDDELVPQVGSSPAAFTQFYRSHVDAVTRFFARRVTDPFTVADLTADTFLAVIESAANYRPESGPARAWLYGIARNMLAAEHRRAAREQRVERRISGRRLLEPDDVARLEEQIDASREYRRLLSDLDRLPERERAVLELVAVDGITVGEAAAVLGVRAGTARVRLHRARRALRHPGRSGASQAKSSVELLAPEALS